MRRLNMPIKKGDFILINYTAKVKETGDTFDTTNEETAKQTKLHKEGETYEPKLIVIGEGWLLKPLDENLTTLKPKKTTTIEIPPQQAFGPRDPQKVRMIPLRRLTNKGITPTMGMRLEFDGKLATVRTMGSGRVQLDFNPPLAGKTLIYEVILEKKVETKNEKISALIHRRIPNIDIEKFKLRLTKKTIIVTIPEEAFYIDGLQLAKRGTAMDIQRFFPDITTVKFTEIFKKKEAT